MMERPPAEAMLDAFAAAAAVCDASGVIRAWNEAFAEWAPDAAGHPVEVNGSRGVLFLGHEPARQLLAVPLADGGWLVFPGQSEAHGALPAVARTVARRLARVESALEENARIGLLADEVDTVRSALRELLATGEEVRVLRRQVAALGADPGLTREAVCLHTLVREGASAIRPRRVLITAGDHDFTVEADRTRLFPMLVGLFEELSDDHGALPVTLRGGDTVRLRVESRHVPAHDTQVIAEARRLLTLIQGRLFLAPAEALTIELPAYVRGTGASGGLGTVLVVDDDDSSLAMMGAVLRRAGFRILSADDGVAASALLREHIGEISVLVADAVLPGRSGLELAAEARKASPGLPILLVSGHSSDLLGNDPDGGLPILSKPFGARALTERVRALLGG